jgi:hypothetical protein
MLDYDNKLIETERICLKYGLVKRLERYFCLPTDNAHFVVEFNYKYLYISTKWEYYCKQDMIFPNNSMKIKFEELEGYLSKFMKEYKEFVIKVKKQKLEKDFV